MPKKNYDVSHFPEIYIFSFSFFDDYPQSFK